MTEPGFQKILKFIEEETGISLPDTNYRNVKKFLNGKLEEKKLDTHGYLELLGRNPAEYDAFINAITINETYFFREEKHFAILDRNILPAFCAENHVLLNIWSAACSSGEEAVSLLAVLQKHRSRHPNLKFNLYATDINPYAVARLRKGEYTKNSFRQDGQSFHPLLDLLGDKQGDTWKMKTDFRKALQIRQFNLNAKDYPLLPGSFRIIFLRNTLLYMKMETRLRIIAQLSRHLEEGGYLFLSMAETALISHADLELEELDKIYFFRKKTRAATPGKKTEAPPIIKISHKEASATRAETAVAEKTITLEDILTLSAGEPARGTAHTGNTDSLQAAQLLKKSIALINAGTHSRAREVISRLQTLIGSNEIIHYLEGYLQMSTGEQQKAAESFRKAVDINSSFWLARFYLAKLSSETSPPIAKREFLICRTQIEHYIETGNFCYQFLLEGFNAKYFQSICSSWIDGYNHKEKA